MPKFCDLTLSPPGENRALVVVQSPSRVLFLQPNGLLPARLLCPSDFSGKNTGLPFPSPGDLPNPGIKSLCPALQADSLPTESLGKPKALENSFHGDHT